MSRSSRGGVIVTRFALYYPSLVTAIFSICTPYPAPSLSFTPLLRVVQTALPNLGYQRQFASGVLEELFISEDEIRSLLNAFYGGVTEDGTPISSPESGLKLDLVKKAKPSRLLSPPEMDYYVHEFARHGLQGPCNYYRTREINWEDEFEHIFKLGTVEKCPPLKQEMLFVFAKRDPVLTPRLAAKMKEGDKEGQIPNLRRREVDTHHWALWEAPEEVNNFIKTWLEEAVFPKLNSDSPQPRHKL